MRVRFDAGEQVASRGVGGPDSASRAVVNEAGRIPPAQFVAICFHEWVKVARGDAAHLHRGDANQKAVLEARAKINAQVTA